MTPLLLLDVDGVLNAVSRRPPTHVWPQWRQGEAVANGRTWSILFAPQVIEAVLAWTRLAEVHWLTTWGHDANTSLRHLVELPELPVAGAPPGWTGSYADDNVSAEVSGSHAEVSAAAADPLTGHWWKFDVVRALVAQEPSRPLVWIDDDLRHEREVQDWMRARSDCLLVAPQTATGLTAVEVEQVQAYLTDSTSG